MSESLEYRTLLECLSSLVTALKSDPATIADDLVSRGLIPPKDVAESTTANVDQARQLARVILDRVSLVPSRYNDVVSVLCKHQWLEDVVDIIQTTYSEFLLLRSWQDFDHYIPGSLETLRRAWE